MSAVVEAVATTAAALIWLAPPMGYGDHQRQSTIDQLICMPAVARAATATAQSKKAMARNNPCEFNLGNILRNEGYEPIHEVEVLPLDEPQWVLQRQLG